MSQFKLLCTFSNQKKLDRSLDLIENNFYNIQKIFIFSNKDNPYEKYVTFNVDLSQNKIYHNFISIHRKKETNTLYSVNAINIIIKALNNGILDTRLQLDWDLYRNTLLLSKREEINVIPIVLDEIIEY